MDIFCPRGIISRTLFADVDFFCGLTRGDLVEHRYLRGADGCCLKAENPKILPKEGILLLCSLGRQKLRGLHPQTSTPQITNVDLHSLQRRKI